MAPSASKAMVKLQVPAPVPVILTAPKLNVLVVARVKLPVIADGRLTVQGPVSDVRSRLTVL